MVENLEMKGEYRIDAISAETGVILSSYKSNVLCQGLFTGLFAELDGNSGGLGLSYIAIGDGTTDPARANTALGNEIFRKAISSNSYNSTEFTAKVQLLAGEGNPVGGSILEVGVFAGGTIAAGSGLLISRAKINIAKNTNIILNISWKLRT